MLRRILLSLGMLCALFSPAAGGATPKRGPAVPSGFILRDGVVIPNCPRTQTQEELRQPNVIRAKDGVLDTKLDVVWVKDKTVPLLIYHTHSGVVACYEITFDLRNYVDPTDNTPKLPGPTLEVRRASPGQAGDRIRILLQNHAGTTDERCIWNGTRDGIPGNCFLDEYGKSLCPPPGKTWVSELPPGFKLPQCCRFTMPPNGMNCFHGGSTTNLHFHGLHVSPQRPQDWIFAQIQPFGTIPGPTTKAMGEPGSVFEGEFQYDVDPLRSDQAEGTFWYHPHKHGSSAEQVGGGMAGALIVRGPFDDFLQEQYDHKLQERILIVQEIHDLNFTTTLPFPSTPHAEFMPLINGQLVPTITMYAGETQRWRFIAATMDAAAQIVVNFFGSRRGPEVRQIAMDGIQFSPNNYYCQPLLDTTPCDGNMAGPTLYLSPGNRADFLVKAPPAKGRYYVSYDVFGAVDKQGAGTMSHTGKPLPALTRGAAREILDLIAPGNATQPALLAVEVLDPPCPPDRACGMDFPKKWPPLPEFLRPIVPTGKGQDLQFQVNGRPNPKGPPPPPPPAPDASFAIFVKARDQVMQFDEGCAAFTEPLDPAGGQEWRISQNLNNGGDPFHVFHIHTNPFQVVSTFVNNKIVRYDTCPEKPIAPCVEPVWQDSLTIPDNQAGVIPGATPKGQAVIRQRFESYTGSFVLHCHFLGHEDRGMMLVVQTVCPSNGLWSETSPDKPECTFGKFRQPLKPCPKGPVPPPAH